MNEQPPRRNVVKTALSGGLVLGWLALGASALVFVAGGLLAGAAMAGSVPLGILGVGVVAALAFGWWKVGELIAVKLGIR